MIPDRNTCLSVLRERNVPKHIIAHSITVERLALFLFRSLVNDGAGAKTLDAGIIGAGALLHDVAKIPAMEAGVNHSEMGAIVMEAKGFVELMPAVARHIRLDDYAPASCMTEAGIINYADKRVNHDEIVSLDDRFAYLYDRYGSKSEEAMGRIKTMHELTRILEGTIFERLPFKPGEVIKIMEEERGFYTR